MRYDKNMRVKSLYRLTAGLALLNVLVWGVVFFEELYRDRVLPATVYAGVAIGGQIVPEAAAAVIAAQTTQLERPITVTADDVTVVISAKDLGVAVDAIAVGEAVYARTKLLFWVAHFGTVAAAVGEQSSYRIVNQTLGRFTTNLKQKVDRPPQNAGLTWQDDHLTETSPVFGRALIAEMAEATIQDAFVTRVPTTIRLPTTAEAPTLTESSQLAKAKSTLEALLQKPLVLQSEGKTITLAPKDVFGLLAFSAQDGALVYDIDQVKTEPYVESLAKQVAVVPVARQLSAAGAVLIEGQDGRQLNRLEAYKQLAQAVATSSHDVAVPTTVVTRSTKTDSGDFYQLGRTEGKYIEISLSKQRLATIEGSSLTTQFAVSTGKWSTPTPTGEFSIQNHIPTAWSARYGLYMDNWMAITSDGGYGIHQLPRWPSGTIEGVSHIGTPVSHGCIRLAPGDAGTVYGWAATGTKVYIHS